VFGSVRRSLRRLRSARGSDARPILFRRAAAPPEVRLGLRALLVLLLIGAVFAVFMIDRGGLTDNVDGHVSISDVLYFTMITITTVGYGDIIPVSDQARLIDAFFVTPVRMFVWFIFLGTAYELIIQRLVEEWHMTRLQKELAGHVVICGYGHSGSVAAGELLQRGWERDRIVVIDSDVAAVQRASEKGFIGLHGNASSEELLRVAGVERAASAIVSVGRDDTTILVVLTLRELSRDVRLIAEVTEPENIKLVRAGGANAVVAPARFGGYLLADAVGSDGTVEFVTGALSYHGRFQLHERGVRPDEVGRRARDLTGSLVLEMRRGDRRLAAWSDPTLVVEPDDRLLVIDSDEVLAG
jgi:voltage-gated potassium channel